MAAKSYSWVVVKVKNHQNLPVTLVSSSHRLSQGQFGQVTSTGSFIGSSELSYTHFGEFASSISEVPKISPCSASAPSDTRAELSMPLYPVHESIITGTESRQTLCSRFPSTLVFSRFRRPAIGSLGLLYSSGYCSTRNCFGSSEDPAFGGFYTPHTPI